MIDDIRHLKFRIGEFEQMNSRYPKKLNPFTPSHRPIYSRVGIALTGLFLSLCVRAESFQDQVDSALNNYVETLIPRSADTRVEGSWQKLDQRLNLPVCTQPIDLAPLNGKTSGRTTLRVSCASAGWSFMVPLIIHGFQKVVVAQNAIARDETITASALALEEKEISPAISGYFTDLAQVSGHIAKRAIGADQILTASMVKSPDIISKGQSVIIEAASGSFAIRTAGTALTNGGMGDTIKVRNTESGRVVEGVVVSDGKIRVAL